MADPRRPYLTATAMTQDFLDQSAASLVNQLELVVDISSPTGTIHVSDRNKYVGSTFYEARLTFPPIARTVGEWLDGTVEFSTLELELSNVDGRFNNLLPGGADYGGTWIGQTVEVRLGVRDVEATYTTIYRGTVTDVGGFGRSTKTIRIVCRDIYDALNTNFPVAAFTVGDYPNIENDLEGLAIPYIVGNWRTELAGNVAHIPSFPVNGNDPAVYGSPFNPVQCVHSVNDFSLDLSAVWLARGDMIYGIPPSAVSSALGGRGITVTQSFTVEGAPYQYGTGDRFYVLGTGQPTLGAAGENVVGIARHLLETFGGLVAGDFAANWTTLQAKPAISAVKARMWVQEPKSLIEYVKSLLSQVRLEMYQDRDLTLSLNSLHFDDWDPTPTFRVRNWDVERETMVPQVDDRTNFNRAYGYYDYSPRLAEETSQTANWKNAGAITALGKTISKEIAFPNLYRKADVETQLVGIIRLSSSYSELVTCNLTWRALLLDVGGFVNLDVKIGSLQYDEVPCMVRSIGYDPDGLKISIKLWSFQMCPFPGYTPGFVGTVGGYSATITEET